ncbi:MAG: adenylyltransferase/cytidyltransferase family protein [Actinomycetia bacterium]|nr:adenylyltransferase/cytidyltransferase family protein [Actinomycetes bacterium]
MDQPTAVIVSGFFSPLHDGHLDMIEAAAANGDKLIVIVNNNTQQLAKKGQLIMDEQARLRIVQALRVVDEALIAVDEDRTVSASPVQIAEKYGADHRLVFANGGDRAPGFVPEAEACEQYGIEMVYGAGGVEKADSSTRINMILGVETEASALPSETS